jgi:hypothetical protein
MPKPTRKVLQTHADDMAVAHGVGFVIDPITLASLFLGLLQMVVRCWFSGGGESAALSGRRMLHEEHDGETYSPRVVSRLRKRVRRHFAHRGHELSEEQVKQIADDILAREQQATDDEVRMACGEGWRAKGDEE